MITTTSFKSLIVAQRRHPTEWLWRECQSIKSQFCEAVVKAGYLSWEQMVSAACRYRLGASKLGGVIFWQIDQDERVRDGKVMYYGPDCHRLKDKLHHPTWVSTLLRQRDPFPNAPHETSHCFFGTHLLTESYFKSHTEITEITERPKGQMEITDDTDYFLNTDFMDYKDSAAKAAPAQPVPKALSVISEISVCHKERPKGQMEITERPKGQIEITDDTDYFLNTDFMDYKDSAAKAAPAQPVPKALSVISEISVCHKNTVCVVEAEKTAVILSEVYPQYVWLAAGGLGEVQVEKFRPLRGHKVVLFPDTDPDGTAFKRWSEAATLVMNQVFWEDSPPIRVSPLLELHATPDQKSRKIDLVDFLSETNVNNNHNFIH